MILKWVEIDLLIFLLHQNPNYWSKLDKFNPERFCSIHSRLVKDYLYNFSGLVKPSLAHFVPKNLSHTNVWLCLHAFVRLSFQVYSIYRVRFCYWYIMVVVLLPSPVHHARRQMLGKFCNFTINRHHSNIIKGNDTRAVIYTCRYSSGQFNP